ncbi:MAG: hypothetical protein IKT41_01770 [Clostridia bacterium]|nr:hypothetical protein [Clostridia bacterium]
MKIESLETVEHIYDTDLVKEALYYIEQGYYDRGQVSKEVISRIANTASQVLSTIKKQPITIDTEVSETEDVAREYFGDDFIAQFEEIRKRLAEQNATLYIHGTDMEIANMAMQTGFEAKNPSITSTAVCQTSYEEAPEYSEFSKMLNWPHRDYKGLVLIAVPNECLSVQGEAQPIWEHRPIPEGEVKTAFSREYAIKPEYIVGVIDVVEKQITENPAYINEHSYDGLVLDDLVSSLNIQRDAKPKDTSEPNIEDDSLLYDRSTDIPSEESPETEAEQSVEEIYRFYNWILAVEESGSPIVEARGHKLPSFQYTDGTKTEKEIVEYISRLTQLVPSLKTMGTDDKEIDDFISDVRLSGISNITEKLKRYQRNIEQHQEIDWGEAEISGGVEVDDWD